MTLDASTLSRRDFIRATSVAALAMMANKVMGGVQESKAAEPFVPRMPDSDWSAIRGFNYQPSYGHTGLELWQKFDAKIIEKELARGKKYFPKMNALRWWQSWDSFLRDPKRYEHDFETSLELAAKVGCKVIPCLFNRWHDTITDYGGIYLDHFVPDANWVQRPKMFDAFLQALVGGHKDDPRIIAWDLCNEPYYYEILNKQIEDFANNETAWLKSLRDRCKELGAQAPITIGCKTFMPLETIEPICDLLCIHPYLFTNANKTDYEKSLNGNVEFALKSHKPLLVSESCWGSLDDKVRVETIRYELSQYKKRNIGWLVYVLHHSLVADSHRPEFGPVTEPGNLAFIEADGSLRPGHSVFNEY